MEPGSPPVPGSETAAVARLRRLSFAQEDLRLISVLVVLIGVGLFLALPFVLSIVALIVMSRRVAYPRALMVPYRKGER